MADPFDMFGDGSDDDDGSSDGKKELGATNMDASILMESANKKIAASQSDHSAPEDAPRASSSDADEAELSKELEKIERVKNTWKDPSYLGPMILVSSLPVGGGRGYVASQQLGPGTLVLVEDPMFEWPIEKDGGKLGLETLIGIIEDKNANEMIRDMEEFHPTKEHVDQIGNDDSEEGRIQVSEMMELVRSSNSKEEWSSVVELARNKNVRSRNGEELTETDLVRLLVSLRYNGLESGVYRHVAMLNHDCFPNCVKFRPSETSHSEVRTVRKVEAGETLTISYVPRVISHASRRKHLWEQHRFDIGANVKDSYLSMELVDNVLPSSSIQEWDEDNLTHRIETTTEELENFFQESIINVTNKESAPQAWEHVKALEVSVLELYNESISQLKNDRHILLIPILILHLDVCELVQKAPLSNAVHIKILVRSLVTARQLLSLQEDFNGPDHFDLARTSLDLAESIAQLLSRAPKQLFELGIDSLPNFGAWSSYESQLRKQHNRIRSLYPYNTSQYINS